MTECKKCGRCCHFLIDGKIVKCPHLTKDNLCDIYDERLGKVIFKRDKEIFYCTLRTNLPYDCKGCPFNTDKPIRDVGY